MMRSMGSHQFRRNLKRKYPKLLDLLDDNNDDMVMFLKAINFKFHGATYYQNIWEYIVKNEKFHNLWRL